jgi:hypothetical protein
MVVETRRLTAKGNDEEEEEEDLLQANAAMASVYFR